VEKGVAEEKYRVLHCRLEAPTERRTETNYIPGIRFGVDVYSRVQCMYVSMASSPPAFVVSTLTHSWHTSANGTHDPRLPSLPADIISVTDCLSSLLYIHPKGIAAIFPS